MTGWPIDGTEIMVKDEQEIFERVSLLSLCNGFADV
jgi:hypothetical protein